MAETQYLAGTHATVSASGLLLACIVDRNLRISYTKSPNQCIDFAISSVPAKVKYLRWASDSSRVLLFSSTYIEIVHLEDEKNRARIENGTEGFGRFEAADFLDHETILTVWEYGRAKLWNVVNGRTQDIESVKTTIDGRSWAVRPLCQSGHHVLVFLSRPGAEDILSFRFSSGHPSLAPVKLPTVDAQSLTWSPNGKWIAVLDSPQNAPSLHLVTADGNYFRSYPSKDRAMSDVEGLGIKSIAWSPDSQSLAVSRHDDHIELVAARTLSPIAMIEHSTVIDQTHKAVSKQVFIWQENVSAAGARTYTPSPQPVSPPLSRTKVSEQPRELGVAFMSFSCDGRYLATIDERMLSTVWIWNVQLLCPTAVLVQHNNIKKLQWHDQQPGLMLIDCAESIAYLFDVDSGEPPTNFSANSSSTVNFSLIPSSTNSTRLALLAISKQGCQVLYPHGRDADDSDRLDNGEGDSIFEVLSGAKHSPSIDLSHTQRIALEAEINDGTVRLDDTFVVKRNQPLHAKDPLDDSDIF